MIVITAKEFPHGKYTLDASSIKENCTHKQRDILHKKDIRREKEKRERGRQRENETERDSPY